MARFFERLSEASMSWLDGLSDRDRRLLSILSIAIASLLVISIVVFSATKISTKRAELERNKQQFSEVRELESQYMMARSKSEQAKRRIKQNRISLFTFIQGVTTRLGLSVKDLTEQSRPLPKSDIVEVSVRLNLSKLSIDKVTALIEELEGSEGQELVKVTKLKISKRFDEPELLDLQMTVSTWKSA
jgi:hypothetical protein